MANFANESDDDEDSLHDHPEIYKLGHDAYVLVILRLVHYVDGHDFSASPLLGLAHAVLLWGVNLVLQLGITLALLGVADSMESPWENAHFLENYNMSIHDASSTLLEAVRSHADTPPAINPLILTRCEEAIGVPRSFYFLIIFLWLVRNLGEIESSWFMLTRFVTSYRRQDSSQTLFDDDDTVIERLDTWLVVVLTIMAPVTKILIVLLITYAGMKFLVLQTNELTIILKSLCMQFVTSVDELLLSMATERSKNATKQLGIRMTLADPGRSNSVWDAGVGGIFYLALMTAAVAYVVQVEFGGLFEFRHSCTLYHELYPFSERPVRRLFNYFS